MLIPRRTSVVWRESKQTIIQYLDTICLPPKWHLLKDRSISSGQELISSPRVVVGIFGIAAFVAISFEAYVNKLPMRRSLHSTHTLTHIHTIINERDHLPKKVDIIHQNFVKHLDGGPLSVVFPPCYPFGIPWHI